MKCKSRTSSPEQTFAFQSRQRFCRAARFSVSPEGRRDEDEDLTHVIRYKDVLKWLKIHRRTLDYYIQRGYLKRVSIGSRQKLTVRPLILV